MRLIDPSPGEILDRLTILHLKIDYAKAAAKPIEHFLDEKHLCDEAFTKFGVIDTSKLHSWVAELSFTNRKIWEGVDQIRTTAWWRWGKLSHLAKEVQALNELRAAVIHRIDTAFNSKAASEKLW